MPTPAGLPKKGERVRFSWMLDGQEVHREGVVLERTRGLVWNLIVQWDSREEPSWVLEAGWYFRPEATPSGGRLRLVQ